MTSRTLAQMDLSRYVVCPLSAADIDRLEIATGKSITPGVREFLAHVGFPQNVVPVVFQGESAFIAAQRYAPVDAFVFAEPAETLLAENQVGEILDLDESVQRVFQSFDEFLGEFVSEPEDPEQLCWAVQLSFSTSREAEVRRLLAESLHVNFASGWQHVDISPAGVRSDAAPALSGDGPPLERLEFPAWPAPTLFLDKKVQAHDIGRLKNLVRLWEESDLGFKLINYGVLPRNSDPSGS